MKLRVALAILALMALAVPAQARPAAAVTVVQADGMEFGDTHELHCTAEACRGNLPILILGRMCHLNVHVAFSVPSSEARVILATDGCVPRLRIDGLEASAIVNVEPNGIASQIIRLPYQHEVPGLLQAPVLRGVVGMVRLDLTREPGGPRQ